MTEKHWKYLKIQWHSQGEAGSDCQYRLLDRGQSIAIAHWIFKLRHGLKISLMQRLGDYLQCGQTRSPLAQLQNMLLAFFESRLDIWFWRYDVRWNRLFPNLDRLPHIGWIHMLSPKVGWLCQEAGGTGPAWGTGFFGDLGICWVWHCESTVPGWFPTLQGLGGQTKASRSRQRRWLWWSCSTVLFHDIERLSWILQAMLQYYWYYCASLTINILPYVLRNGLHVLYSKWPSILIPVVWQHHSMTLDPPMVGCIHGPGQ